MGRKLRKAPKKEKKEYDCSVWLVAMLWGIFVEVS